MSFSCLLVSLEVLLLSLGLPVRGSNGKFLSSHQVQEATFTRNIETQTDGFGIFQTRYYEGESRPILLSISFSS